MTQPAALGMTQPRTRNPATNPARPRLPHLHPHPRRHPSRPRPRPHGLATPIVSHPCAPATEQRLTTARRPRRATPIVSHPCAPATEQRLTTAWRPHRATPIVPHPCASATEQRPTAPRPRAAQRSATPRPRAISRNRHEAWSKEERIWNHGILGGRSGEGRNDGVQKKATEDGNRRQRRGVQCVAGVGRPMEGTCI